MTSHSTPKPARWGETSPWCVIINLALLYILYMVCRLVFVSENWHLYQDTLGKTELWSLLAGSLRYDTAAIMYTNLPYLLLVLLPYPLRWKLTRGVQLAAKILYVGVNAIALTTNLMDSVYYQFVGRRTTAAIFDEVAGNTNTFPVICAEALNHWYLVILGAAMIAALILLYRRCLYSPQTRGKAYYIRQGVTLLVALPLIWTGMRGRLTGHPITVAEANQYVGDPTHGAIVTNTPYAIIRSSSAAKVVIPAFYADLAQAESVFSPVITPADSLTRRDKNIVVIVVEGLSEEFLGAVERPEVNDGFMGLTPFIDSLYREGLTFSHSFANGYRSMDNIPSIQSSILKFHNPYPLSPYAMDDTPGLAKDLKDRGYRSAYFHGAEESSFGLKASAVSTGMDEYYCIDDYVADPRFGGMADYDGMWGIWDDRFLPYFCARLTETPEPFNASILTMTTHHPFKVPERRAGEFPELEGEHPIYKCVRYTDAALREFFEQAKRQPWYGNTVFVITADHCFHTPSRPAYSNYAADFRVPLIFFDPSGEMPRGHIDAIAQQTDIRPTLLEYLGHDRPYTAYGKSLLSTPAEETWAFIYEAFPQYFKGDYLVQMGADYKPSAVYRFRTDFTLKDNLLHTGDYDKDYVGQMVREMQAILQSEDTRLRANTLQETEIR